MLFELSAPPEDSDTEPILPPELIIRIGRFLLADHALRTLGTLVQTSTLNRDLLQKVMYSDLEVTDSELRALVSVPVTMGGGRVHTKSIKLINPFTDCTAEATLRPKDHPPPFPNLHHLTLPVEVLSAIPGRPNPGPGHGDGRTSNQYEGPRLRSRRQDALCQLGPIAHLLITGAGAGAAGSATAGQEQSCPFDLADADSQGRPDNLGLSSFLPRLARLLPTINDITYDAGASLHADMIFPTTGITTTYLDPCACWFEHGPERMGLGLALAWVGEKVDKKGSTKVVIKITSTRQAGEERQEQEPDVEDQWDAFHDRVIAYLKLGSGGVGGRTIKKDGKERLKCLQIVLDHYE